MASNVTDMMVLLDNDVQQLGGAPGVDHAKQMMKEEQLEELKDMFSLNQPFSKTRPKVIYKQKMRCWWAGDGLNLENITRFIDRRMDGYRKSRNMRPY